MEINQQNKIESFCLFRKKRLNSDTIYKLLLKVEKEMGREGKRERERERGRERGEGGCFVDEFLSCRLTTQGALTLRLQVFKFIYFIYKLVFQKLFVI
jgi:hypothetical protein